MISRSEPITILHSREENILYWLRYVLNGWLTVLKNGAAHSPTRVMKFDMAGRIMSGTIIFTGEPAMYWYETDPQHFHRDSYYRTRKKP